MIFVWEGGRRSALTLFFDVLSPQYIVQRGLYFDSSGSELMYPFDEKSL